VVFVIKPFYSFKRFK